MYLLCLSLCPQGAEHCSECRNFQDGEFCVDHCPSGVKEDQQTVWKYSNATGHCLPCNTNCTLSWVDTRHTHTSTETARTVRRISHRALLCFSCTVMDERGCPVDTRTGWDTLCPVTIVSTFISRFLFEESELCWTVRLCSGRVQPSRLQWAAWCSSSSCWLCWSSTWGDRRSWRGRRQWGGSCKNTRWAQILMFYHLLEVKRKT